MNDTFFEELPAVGVTLGPLNLHGTDYTVRGVEDGFWVIDGPAGIQTEIRTTDDGTLSMMRTDGKTHQHGEGDSWEEIVAQYF